MLIDGEAGTGYAGGQECQAGKALAAGQSRGAIEPAPALFVRPLGIGFQAEHPVVGLLVVADLAAGNGAVHVKTDTGNGAHRRG